MRRTVPILLVALVLAPTASALVGAAGVNIVNFAFQDHATRQSVTTAAAGAPITWIDVAGVHTASGPQGTFDSGPLEPGETFTTTLPPGVYPYACRFHPSMRGTLVVV